MNLAPPSKVGKLQKTLHDKAVEFPGYRFYALYDKIYRMDVLRHAYECCRENDGKPGVDHQTFEKIEEYGEERWLEELAEELRTKKYCPQPVRRVWIPKGNTGKKRPLGIPTIRDRVVQKAVVLVLEPIFEADMPSEQYAYREGRSALQAVSAVQGWMKAGYREVVDADLSGYFDTIPHVELMQSVTRRISDRNLLRLIKAWLEAAVEERNADGGRSRTTRNKDEGRGTPQGGVLSPLLANVYMRRFVLGWKTLRYGERLRAHIVNYADDFVICAIHGQAEKAMEVMRVMMRKLKLTVNETKTRLCIGKTERFTFLSYEFGLWYSRRTGKGYLNPRPSGKSVQSLCRKISELTKRRKTWRETGEVVEDINRKLIGWSSYFCLGTVVHAYEIVMKHTRRRLRRWLSKKHKVRRGEYKRFPNEYLHMDLGLTDLLERRKALANQERVMKRS